MPRPTLLVADPDPRSLRMLELALRKAGFAVQTAQDGARALESVLSAPPDVVVCDTALPSLDGIAVCRVAREKLPRLPVVVIGADKADAPRALEAGADEFLRKPILLKELVLRVQRLLQHRELSQSGETAAITGSVRDLGLVDALQALLGAKKSALVTCEAYGRSARIWVREGEVVDAELETLQGEAAFWRLMTWESGSFRIEQGPVDREARIAGGTQAALVEALRRVDEMGRVSEELAMTTLLAVDPARLSERLGELPDEVNGVVRNFDGRRTLREAIDLSPVDDLSTVEVVRRLLADGILREVESKKSALPGKPSLEHWLSNPPPAQPAPHLALEAARAAALVEEMAEAEVQELRRQDDESEDLQNTARTRRPPALALDVVRFPPLRGVRRDRLRRESEEARARVEQGKPVRLSRVVELPPREPDGSDVLADARRMSPAVGEAAKTFAPDGQVARVLTRGPALPAAAPPEPRAAATLPDPPAQEARTDPPEPITTPPIAPVAPVTPAPAQPGAAIAAAEILPAPAAIAPGTPPPDRQREAAMMKALQPPRRPWAWYGIGAAAALAAAWYFRGQPSTDKKDAPWLEKVAVERTAPPLDAPPPPPAPPGPPQPDLGAPPIPEPSAPAQPPAPGSAAAPTASETLYAKALEQGDSFLRRGKYRSAIGHFQRAVKERPESVPALLALGDAYLEADKPRSAVTPLETAARIEPGSGRAQLLLGTAYQSLGRNAQAQKAYRRYLELEPHGEFVRDVRLVLANLRH